MATINDLFRRTQTLIDDNLNNIDMVDWFAQCQDDLTDILYIPTLKTIAKVGGLFPIPTDSNGELKILEPTGIDVYSVYDGAMYFDGYDSSELTEIQVTYNKLPEAITNDPTQVPSIPAIFHSVFVTYAAMMAMHPEEEPERYALYEREYMKMRKQIQTYMGKLRPKPTAWRVVR